MIRFEGKLSQDFIECAKCKLTIYPEALKYCQIDAEGKYFNSVVCGKCVIEFFEEVGALARYVVHFEETDTGVNDEREWEGHPKPNPFRGRSDERR